MLAMCEEHNVIFTSLLPNATHRLQPLNISVFRPAKLHWRSILRQWRLTLGHGERSRNKLLRAACKTLQSVGGEDRGFSKSWLTRFDWLSYNSVDNSMACRLCRQQRCEGVWVNGTRNMIFGLQRSQCDGASPV